MREEIPRVIAGFVQGRRATLEITGDTLIWRASENVATTIHEVKRAVWAERRLSVAAIVVAALSVAWIASESPVVGACGFAAAIGLQAWRAARPSRHLVLLLHDRRLLMRVSAASSSDARELAARIEQAREAGEMPSHPPALP